MVSVPKLIAVLAAAGCGFIVYFMADSFFAGAFLAVLALLLIVGILFLLISGRRTKLSAEGSLYGQRDERSTFRVRAVNGSIIPVPDLDMKCSVKNLLTEEEEVVPLKMAAGSKGKGEEEIEVPAAHSGCIELTLKETGVKDPFGIFKRRLKKDASARHYVMPKPGTMALAEEQISTYDMESYKYSEDRGGTDTSETFDIREYAAGDSIKAIHWKLSAKADDIVIKEPSHPIENRIILILDKTRKLPAGEIDRYVDLLSALSEGLLEREILHSIGWYDESKARFIVKSVSDQQEKWNALMEMMTSPFRDSELSTPYRFVEEGIEDRWSSYIYITSDERDMERLAEYGEVSIARP